MRSGIRLATIVTVATLSVAAFAGCGTGRGTGTTSTTSNPPSSSASSAASTTTTSAAGGFAANAMIGVSLPWLGTQNWQEGQTMFADQLKAAGFTPNVQAADNTVQTQQQQITAMIQAGAKVIVIGPVDGAQLGTIVDQAKAADIYIIGYDRMIQNTPNVDAVVQFGSVKTGELQGQSLLDGLAAKKGPGPYNIELFGGGPTDPNAPNFFTGAMKVLQPKIDDGTLVVVSGQKDFPTVATQDWDNQKAQARMDTLLSGFYGGGKKIDGVLAPNDGIARAIMTSCEDAGQPVPVVDGLDAEDASVTLVWQGKQWSTTYKPTDKLVAQTITLIKALQAGQPLPAPTEKDNNGVKDVAVYAQDPVIVTQANAKEVFKNDPARLKLLT
ncbi:MAG: sugar-binding protein [Actinomycetia bacterium]|nr:sugar-binding protein [Actinomycetes bacterium]